MQAFVTGSTGLLGSNLVRGLIDAGWTVKALVRSAKKARDVFSDLNAGDALTFIEGDMQNIPAFTAQLQGCDALFHVAAYFREYYQPGNHWDLLESINVTGTVRLLEAAERAGVRKAIYVSSSGVIGAPINGRMADESTQPDATVMQNLYFKSKVLAEQAVAEFLKTHTLPVVLILPTWMYGPGDSAPTTSGRLVQDFLRKGLPTRVPGGSMVVDARDVAQAMIAAVECGKSGERYLIGGRATPLDTILQTLEAVSGIAAPTMRIPYRAAVAFAWVSERRARMTNTETLVSLEGIRTLHRLTEISSAKAQRELNITFRPLTETLRDEVNWYRAHAH